jgi:hypothetical protein
MNALEHLGAAMFLGGLSMFAGQIICLSAKLNRYTIMAKHNQSAKPTHKRCGE